MSENPSSKKRGRPRKTATATPKVAQQKLVEPKKTIKPENYFFLKDGRALKDISELAKVLDSIGKDVFDFHVNDAKNDFSNWIRDIIGEKELAEAIRKIKDPKQTRTIILKHVKV